VEDPRPPGKRRSRRAFLKATTALGAGIALGAYGTYSLMRPGEKADGNGEEETSPVQGKEAMFYESTDRGTVECQLCPNACTIPVGTRGTCEVRENRGGKLYSLVYGKACTYHVDPIEKKPLFHFLPATHAFSIATAGCNFQCLYCQNWEISQARPEELESIDLPPELVVEMARQTNSASIAYTYNEPNIFYEYMYDTCRLAKDAGVRNLEITNGYLEAEPLKQLCGVLDGANVDLKGFTERFYNNVCSGELWPVQDTLVTMKRRGVWFEITNLIVPTLNDDPAMISDMCDWIVAELGTDNPLHFSRFTPRYMLEHLPYTPTKTLEEAREMALEKGIKYVYIGNILGHPAENTYCHSCGGTIIERIGFSVLANRMADDRCSFCGARIPGVWS
jgi:pyruvate formate lyase activating enzyme